MKTLFICAKGAVFNHVDEEYDEILYVEDIPNPNTINESALQIGDAIRRLWEQQKEDEQERLVMVSLDAMAAFRAVIINFQVIMFGEEKIVVEFEGGRGEILGK